MYCSIFVLLILLYRLQTTQTSIHDDPCHDDPINYADDDIHQGGALEIRYLGMCLLTSVTCNLRNFIIFK